MKSLKVTKEWVKKQKASKTQIDEEGFTEEKQLIEHQNYDFQASQVFSKVRKKNKRRLYFLE